MVRYYESLDLKDQNYKEEKELNNYSKKKKEKEKRKRSLGLSSNTRNEPMTNTQAQYLRPKSNLSTPQFMHKPEPNESKN